MQDQIAGEEQACCLSPCVQLVTIQIPYGTTVLHPGMKLPIISRDAQMVHVRYLDEVYPIPIASTDLK